MQETYLTDLITLADGLPVAMLPFLLKELKGEKALEEAGIELVKELKLRRMSPAIPVPCITSCGLIVRYMGIISPGFVSSASTEHLVECHGIDQP